MVALDKKPSRWNVVVDATVQAAISAFLGLPITGAIVLALTRNWQAALLVGGIAGTVASQILLLKIAGARLSAVALTAVFLGAAVVGSGTLILEYNRLASISPDRPWFTSDWSKGLAGWSLGGGWAYDS